MSRDFDARVAANGRLVLPKGVREAFSQTIRDAQSLYQTYADRDASVDDFLAERRSDTEREERLVGPIAPA